MPAINNSPVLGGMNVRPLAQSAVKAGFEVVAIDAIGLLCFERRAISILEVNPRNSASMELIEDALGVPLIEWHAAWCRQQSFPMFQERHDQNVFGKAIV